MTSTEHLYRQLDEADNELSDIRIRARALAIGIEGLIRAFAEDHGCGETSTTYAIEYAADALTDLIDDAEGPAARRKIRIEDEIGEIENADLMRSIPAAEWRHT